MLMMRIIEENEDRQNMSDEESGASYYEDDEGFSDEEGSFEENEEN